jgi:hypothetical protein
MIEQSFASAQAVDAPFSLAPTVYFTAAAAQMLGDVTLATANSERSMQMATEHDLAQPKALSMGVAGWCAAETGTGERGLALATQAITAMHAINSRHSLPLRMRPSARGSTGRISACGRDGEHFYDAELLRLRGDFPARCPDTLTDSETSFEGASKIAQQQGARALLQKINESMQCAGRRDIRMRSNGIPGRQPADERLEVDNETPAAGARMWQVRRSYENCSGRTKRWRSAGGADLPMRCVQASNDRRTQRLTRTRK